MKNLNLASPERKRREFSRACGSVVFHSAKERPFAERKATIKRRAFTLLELTIALLVFSVLLLVVGQTIALVAQQRRLSERRDLATQSAANVMELVFALPWNELTAEKLADFKLPSEVERDLPGGALRIEVSEIAGPPAARRLRVEVGWHDAAGPVGKPATITAWRYEP